VLSGALRVFLLCLLSPCLRGTEAIDVDQNALAGIVSHIEDSYRPGRGRQFAVAMNIPADYCTGKLNLKAFREYFKDYTPELVKTAISSDSRIYVGDRLIGARPKPISPYVDANYHTEYLLLVKSNPPGESPADPLIKKILNKDKEGCVIFYTYYSPCDRTCLNARNPRNILKALGIFKEHKGPKAFIYNYPFKGNNDGIVEHGAKIHNNLPLYSCYSYNGFYECHLCVKGEEIVDACL
ncbi:hypothetical protein NFI96_024600, partial [Prochilodus magdalenae]